MHEKPVKLPMEFGEALARLARVPKAAAKTAASEPLEKASDLGHTKTGAIAIPRRAAGKRKARS